MDLPSPSAVPTMRGRNVLALAADWFESEGRRAQIDIDALTVLYGEDAIGEEMRVRTAMCFAVATFISTVRAKAEQQGARRNETDAASQLANALRGGFIPSQPKAAA